MNLIRVAHFLGGVAAVLMLVAGSGSAVLAQTCTNQWSNMFPGGAPDMGQLRAFVVFDGELYVGGSIDMCMGQNAYNVVKWNGYRWAAVGDTLDTVNTLVVYDDPNEPPTVYAGSASGVYRFVDGVWEAVGDIGSAVNALVVLDEPNEPSALYAGGVSGVYQWLNNSWVAIGAIGSAVNALAVFDERDPNEPRTIYAGSVSGVYKWSNGSWATVGSTNGVVYALAALDDPNEPPALYAGGKFTEIGGVSANRIAVFRPDSGGTWSWYPLGGGVTHTANPNRTSVSALVVVKENTLNTLYVGGVFDTVWDDGEIYQTANNVARWSGDAWWPLAGGTGNSVLALAAFDDGGGSAVYAGGGLTKVDGIGAPWIARWRDETWTPLGRAPNNAVYAFQATDAWDGPALYVGGAFDAIGDVRAKSLAKWDGSSWTPLGSGVPMPVNALITFNDGSGLDLWVGGGNACLPHTCFHGEVGCIMRGRMQQQQQPDVWQWVWWGPTVTCNEAVCAFSVFEDVGDPNNPGSMLYAAGEFTEIGGNAVEYIARWNGSVWEPVDCTDPDRPQSPVYSLAVYQEPNEPAALYAGSDGVISKLQNGTWWPVSSYSSSGTVYALAGLGGELYAVAAGDDDLRWSGGDWVSIHGRAFTLHVHDDGRGPALYVGGATRDFYNKDPNDPNYDPVTDHIVSVDMARWDGQCWESVGDGVGDHVYALGTFDDGIGDLPALYVGGHLLRAGGDGNYPNSVDSQYIARWGYGGIVDWEAGQQQGQ